MDSADTLMAAGGLAAPFHAISPQEVEGLLAERYGWRGSLRRFDTEKDDTFLVTGGDGARIILKIANPLEDEREISIQLEALLHIETADPGLPVPKVVRSLEGLSFFTIRDEAGQTRIVRALSFLDGTTLDKIRSKREERRRLGAMLGRLRLALAGFSHPHERREIAWDVKHLPRLAGLLSHIGQPQHRRALERGLERFDVMAGRLSECRMQVVHNDCSRSNIVVDRARPDFVSGIIDFGDVVRTAIAIDVSTTLLNQLSKDGRGDMFAHGKDVLSGYLEVASLTDTELAMVPHLVMARVIARALITTWRADRFPANRIYIMRNTHQGWSQLDWFLSRSMAEVSDTFAAFASGPAATGMRKQA